MKIDKLIWNKYIKPAKRKKKEEKRFIRKSAKQKMFPKK